MDKDSSEGSPSSALDSQRRTCEPRFGDPSDELPSMDSSETSLHPQTQPDSRVRDSGVGGATSGRVLSLREEDSKRPPEESSPPRQSRRSGREKASPTGLSAVQSLSGHFTGQALNFRLPCTATEDTTCQIFDHLSAWNEFLCPASWLLQEMPGSSAKLSLVFFREPIWGCSPSQLHLAALLVCELLNRHHCVAHVEMDIFHVRAHFRTLSDFLSENLSTTSEKFAFCCLSDALRDNPSITSVKLSLCGCVSGEDFTAVAFSLPHLQELECSNNMQHSPTLISQLSTFLLNTTSLSALRLSKECPKDLSCEEFFRGLGQNSSLKELVLPSRLIAEAPTRAKAMFVEWLTSSVSLKSLTVTSLGRGPFPLMSILGAIRANRSIIAVDITCPEVIQLDVELLSRIFEENKVLRIFKISYKFDYYFLTSSFVQHCLDKGHGDRCVQALIENHTLEEVALPFDVLDEVQWKELFEALPAKRKLKTVSIEALRRAPPSVVGKFCSALKETGADEKVSFNASFSENEFDEICGCKAFSSVFLTGSENNKVAVYGMLERLPSLGHITCLYLNFDTLIDAVEVLSSNLATFLKATRTLKSLGLGALRDMWLYDCQEGLMDGLAHNGSLREVQIQVGIALTNSSVFQERLAEAIKESKNITRASLGGAYCAERGFFQWLSTGIADNYTLLSVDVPGDRYSKFSRYWFKVWDTTRRNCGLLIDAADFARGARHDRRCGLALDRMHSHPELVEEVARLEEVDQTEAASMVRDGLQRMDGLHEFMRLAGVVKKQVSCYPHEDGHTQLDALNEHCWRAVKRFLKLRDVKEPTAEMS